MNTRTPKVEENKSRSVANSVVNSVAQKKNNVKQGFGFVDNRHIGIQMENCENIGRNNTVGGVITSVVQMNPNEHKSSFFKEHVKYLISCFKTVERVYRESGKTGQRISNLVVELEREEEGILTVKDKDIKKMKKLLPILEKNADAAWVRKNNKRGEEMDVFIGGLNVWAVNTIGEEKMVELKNCRKYWDYYETPGTSGLSMENRRDANLDWDNYLRIKKNINIKINRIENGETQEAPSVTLVWETDEINNDYIKDYFPKFYDQLNWYGNYSGGGKPGFGKAHGDSNKPGTWKLQSDAMDGMRTSTKERLWLKYQKKEGYHQYEVTIVSYNKEGH